MEIEVKRVDFLDEEEFKVYKKFISDDYTRLYFKRVIRFLNDILLCKGYVTPDDIAKYFDLFPPQKWRTIYILSEFAISYRDGRKEESE